MSFFVARNVFFGGGEDVFCGGVGKKDVVVELELLEFGGRWPAFCHHRVANSRDSSMPRPVSLRSRCRSVLLQNLGVLNPFIGKNGGKTPMGLGGGPSKNQAHLHLI